MAQAAGLKHIVFSTGGKSEEHLKALLPELPEEAFVQMGDYVRFALKVAGHMGFSEITVGAFFGKALKIAQGFGHTHASRGLADLKELGRWTLDRRGMRPWPRRWPGPTPPGRPWKFSPRPGPAGWWPRWGQRMLAALRDYAGPGPGAGRGDPGF